MKYTGYEEYQENSDALKKKKVHVKNSQQIKDYDKSKCNPKKAIIVYQE